MRAYLFVLLTVILLFPATSVWAACTNPASPAGGISYDSAGDFMAVLACDGTDWVPWAGWTITGYPAPQYSSNTLNDLTDVNTTGVADGEVLLYSAGVTGWVPGTAGGGTTAMPNGTIASPGWPFASDTDTGFSRTQSNALDVSAGGVQVARFSGTTPTIYMYGEMQITDGAASYPGINFRNDQNTGLFRPAVDTLAFVTGGGEKMRLDSNGYLGINDTNPSVALDVVGDINFTGQIVDVSDIRMKYDIAPLQSPLKKLTSLNGISFKMKGDPKHVTEYGVSAQDVQKVFPELVSVVDPDNGTLGVNYNGLIAPLIEAMKEQQAQIEALQAEIESLKAERNNKPGEL